LRFVVDLLPAAIVTDLLCGPPP